MRYTVKQVSLLTGVSTDLLRAWQRRYRVVEPERSESGYRLYGEEDVARLRRMAELVDAGTPASLAAEQVLAAPPGPTVDAGSPGPEGRWTPVAAPSSPWPAIDLLVEHGRTLDRAGLESTLDAVLDTGSFESAWEDWLAPALRALGDAWATGEVDVAGEHFVTSAVHRRLSRTFEAARTGTRGPVVAIGLPAGSQHELPALALATGLRRRGVDVRYLGADLPTADWVAAVTRLAPTAVVLSVPTRADAGAGAGLVSALAAAAPGTRLLAGGDGCRDWHPELPVQVLSIPVTEGVEQITDLLTR